MQEDQKFDFGFNELSEKIKQDVQKEAVAASKQMVKEKQDTKSTVADEVDYEPAPNANDPVSVKIQPRDIQPIKGMETRLRVPSASPGRTHSPNKRTAELLLRYEKADGDDGRHWSSWKYNQNQNSNLKPPNS